MIRQELELHRVTEQYVDLRSKCEILSCNMPNIEGSVMDMDADDSPDDPVAYVENE